MECTECTDCQWVDYILSGDIIGLWTQLFCELLGWLEGLIADLFE